MNRNIASEIKQIFRDYQRLNSSKKNKLRKLGFTIINQKKHYKLFYKGGKYPFILPKTGSDQHHGGLNLAHVIIRKLALPV